MKKIALIVLSAVILFAAPSCKKQSGKLLKHVVAEEYVYADPCDQEAAAPAPEKEPAKEKEAKTPKLWKCQAKSLVKNVLKENGVINTPRVVPVAVGYYECNCGDYRELLYKAQVNGLVDVAFSDIAKDCGELTYWVTASLTPKGKALIVENDDPIYPEDTITNWSVLYPNSGLNKYGVYTYDANVDPAVNTLIHDFYKAYIMGADMAISSYGTNDLVMAQARINKAKELGVRKNIPNPFIHTANLDAAAVNAMDVYKWTTYEDLYLAVFDNVAFCLVVKEEGGIKKIDDIACTLQKDDNSKKLSKLSRYTLKAASLHDCSAIYNPLHTLRYFALNITARELHDAQKALDVKPLDPKRLDPVAPSVANVPATPLLFDEYNPALQPGIVEAPQGALKYLEAKANEVVESFNLLAFDKKLACMGKLKDVKGEDLPTKKAEIAIKTVKVSPLGRICYEAKDGEVKEYIAYFKYIDEEWVCIGVNEKVEISFYVPVQEEVKANVTSSLKTDECDCK